jgi:hypothetical protein
MRIALAALLLAASAGACGGTSPEECRTYANELGAMLELAAQDPPAVMSLPDDLSPVVRSDLPRRDEPWAKSIEITPTETRYFGESVPHSELSRLLASDLDVQTKMLERYPGNPDAPRPDPRLVYVVIDARASWPTVVDVIDTAIKAGMTSISIGFEVPQPLQLPPRAPIDAKIDAILKDREGQRASKMAKLVEDQVRGCPAITVAFEAAMRSGYDDRATQLAKAIPVAVTNCKCRVNMPDLRSSLFRLLYIPRPMRVIRLDPTKPATTIELPATAVWADAAKLLDATTPNAHFVIKG